jgi:hypothetical protein
MDSDEVLRRAVEAVGAKQVAADLKVSKSLVYKWCAEADESSARNPLDRIDELVKSTGSLEPIEWLCRQAGGYLVKDPTVELAGYDAEYISYTQKMLQNFSELLRVISDAMTDDRVVDEEESERIRSEWERLKGYAETFVVACEQGMFGRADEEES